MAGHFFTVNSIVTPTSAAPQTLIQIIAASNHRALIHGVEIAPQGSTGASVPLLFAWALQSDSTGLTAVAAGEIVKQFADAPETLATTAKDWNADSSAITVTSVLEYFNLHQQAQRRFESQNGPIVVVGGALMGLQCLTVAPGFAIRTTVYCEE